MDRSSYPFNNAAPRRKPKDKEAFAVNKFPVVGANQPLHALSVSLADKKFAQSWEGSSAWFGDKLSQTWGKDVEAEEKAKRAFEAAERERERLANILPRAITGDELSRFGVLGKGKEPQLKRAYRSVNANTLLTQLPPHEAPERPEMLKPKNSSLDLKFKREWLLVPKDELEELTKLEAILKKESNQISVQAALTVNRVGLSVIEPLPMSKLAVEDVCNRQMNKARKQVETLSKQRWEKQMARNKKRLGYDVTHNGGYGEKKYKVTVIPKPKKIKKMSHSAKSQNALNKLDDNAINTIGIMYKDDQEDDDKNDDGKVIEDDDAMNMAIKKKRGTFQTLSCVKLKKSGKPTEGGSAKSTRELLAYKSIEERSMRWLESQRVEENKIGAIEREEMGYEEAIQRHADVYTEAYERKLDYQWYYVLAARYGALSPEEFNSSDRPGTMYLEVAVKGALGLQKLWRHFYPLLLAKRYRAARLIQSVARMRRVRKRWGPIIKFRCRYGRRKVKQFGFDLLKVNIKRVMRIRELIHLAKFGWSIRCLKCWKQFAIDSQNHKVALAELVLMKILKRVQLEVWAAWAKFAHKRGLVTKMFRKNLNRPCFEIWLEMTAVYKTQRFGIVLAVEMQRRWRGHQGRKRAATVRWLIEKLKWLARGKRARIDVGRQLSLRKKKVTEAEVFLRRELLVSNAVAYDLELRYKLTEQATKAAHALEVKINKWLSRGKGKKQLTEWAKAKINAERKEKRQAMKKASTVSGGSSSVGGASTASSGGGLSTSHGSDSDDSDDDGDSYYGSGVYSHNELEQAKEDVKHVKIKEAKLRAMECNKHNVLAKAQRKAHKSDYNNVLLGGGNGIQSTVFQTPRLHICPNPNCWQVFPTERHYLQHGKELEEIETEEMKQAARKLKLIEKAEALQMAKIKSEREALEAAESALTSTSSHHRKKGGGGHKGSHGKHRSGGNSTLTSKKKMKQVSKLAAAAAAVELTGSIHQVGGKLGSSKANEVTSMSSMMGVLQAAKKLKGKPTKRYKPLQSCPGSNEKVRDLVYYHVMLNFGFKVGSGISMDANGKLKLNGEEMLEGKFEKKANEDSESDDDSDDDSESDSDESSSDDDDEKSNDSDDSGESDITDKSNQEMQSTKKIKKIKKRKKQRLPLPPANKDALELVKKGVKETGISEPRFSGADCMMKFLQEKVGLSGGAVFLLRFIMALQDFVLIDQDSKMFETAMGAICDRFLDPLTSAQPVSSFLSPSTIDLCLKEAVSCRGHTEQGRKKNRLKKFGVLGQLYQSYTNPNGYQVWDDGKLNPRPLLQARYEAIVALRNVLETLHFRNSEHYEKYNDEMKRVQHEEEEKLKAIVLLKNSQDMFDSALYYRQIASDREAARQEKFDFLLENTMNEAVEQIEEKIFDDALWYNVHKVSARWDVQSADSVADVQQSMVDEVADELIEKYIQQQLTQLWADEAVEIILQKLLDEQIHREIASKILIEGAIGHGLRVEASLRPPRTKEDAKKKDLLILLVDNGDVDDTFIQACIKIQKFLRVKKARKLIKKMLVSLWRKRYDESSGYYYYENQLSGETVWDPPKAFSLFFPELEW